MKTTLPIVPVVRMGGLTPAWYPCKPGDDVGGYVVPGEFFDECDHMRKALEAIVEHPACSDPSHRHAGGCSLYSIGAFRRVQEMARKALDS